MIDVDILKTQKHILELLMTDQDYRNRNLEIICDSCSYYDHINTCLKENKNAIRVRRSPVYCAYHSKFQIKRSITVSSVIRALRDSLRINDFYPLFETLQGNTYELKKKKPIDNRK